MYLQEIFEVVIGLVFIWLVLSTATMQVGEWIANLFKWRSTDLEKTLRRMFGDEDLTRLFYDHPLIRSLSADQASPDARPSYIPANQFSTALLNIIQDAGTESALLLQRLYGLIPLIQRMQPRTRRKQARLDLERVLELARLSSTVHTGQPVGNLMIASVQKEITGLATRYPELNSATRSILESTDARKTEIDALVGTLPNAQPPAGDFNKVLRGSLALRVTNPSLRLTLSSLLMGIEDASGDCLQVLRANIESWFNASMDRLSGHYKRRAQVTAFLVGLVIAAVLNVDTVSISNQLWREPIVRQAINANATQLLAQSGQATPPSVTSLVLAMQDQFLNLTLPVGWSFSSQSTLAGMGCSLVPGAGSTFGLAWGGGCLRPVDTPLASTSWLWTVTKVAGLLMTGLAASQGSSFWFDILVKIVNVRGAGIKPV
jgi:hypothetical protein